MNILLLGAQGQLGHELSPLLGKRGALTALGRAELDIADLGALRDVLASTRPRLIANATAYNLVDRAESEPEVALRVNAEAVAILGEYAKKEGAALVHYSTDFVFDGRKGAPYVETDTPNPLSAYGRSKLEGERALLRMDAPAVSLRTAWVYSLRRKSFVSIILKLAREQEEMKVVDDAFGSPTWCRDLARATAHLVDYLGKDPAQGILPVRGVYHAAGAGVCSRADLAVAAMELDPRRSEHVVKRIVRVPASTFPAPAARPANAGLDSSKFERTFGAGLKPWRAALEEAVTSVE